VGVGMGQGTVMVGRSGIQLEAADRPWAASWRRPEAGETVVGAQGCMVVLDKRWGGQWGSDGSGKLRAWARGGGTATGSGLESNGVGRDRRRR
jgi:hypothetical protein